MVSWLLTDAVRTRLTTSNEIIVLFGPRQVGKTTLVRSLLGELPYRSLAINADELLYQTVLSSRDLSQMRPTDQLTKATLPDRRSRHNTHPTHQSSARAVAQPSVIPATRFVASRELQLSGDNR